MGANIQAFNGQSNYDICMEISGSLDGFINLLNSNQLNSNQVKGSYNQQSILNSNLIGITYATNYSINSDSSVYGSGYGDSYS